MSLPATAARTPPAQTAVPDVSIVIVNWNTRDLLRDCLQSLRQQAGPVACEVIVVDNHSADDSVEMVRQDFPEVRLIANTANRGFAAANNQGIAIARGRYILLLNSDTRVVDGTIARTVAFADAHPDAGLVGCRTTFPDGRLQVNCFQLPNLLNIWLSLTKLEDLFARNRFFGQRRLTWWNYDTVREVEGIAGCFMLARRDALWQVGPMAEDYFMYSEDTDWCWRFRRAGWKVLYTPEPLLIHIRAASSNQCATDMHLLQRRALLMFVHRRSGRLARELANAMFLAASLVRLPLLAVQRLRGGRRAEQARQQWPRTRAALGFHFHGRLPAELHRQLEDQAAAASGVAIAR